MTGQVSTEGGVVLFLEDGQTIEFVGISIEYQHPDVSLSGQRQYVGQILGHALGQVLPAQLLGGDAFDVHQVLIRPGCGDQLDADGWAVRDAKGDEQEPARCGDIRQFAQVAARCFGDVGRADLPGTAVEARLELQIAHHRLGIFQCVAVAHMDEASIEGSAIDAVVHGLHGAAAAAQGIEFGGHRLAFGDQHEIIVEDARLVRHLVIG